MQTSSMMSTSGQDAVRTPRNVQLRGAPLRCMSADRLEIPVRFAGFSPEQKKTILKTAPIAFVGGADYRVLADTPEKAAAQVRAAALKAMGEAQLASHPRVKGPLAEGWGGAALVQVDSGEKILLADSNISYRTDIKICAEQNLLDRIIKHPSVLASGKPEIKLISNILFNFEDRRYHNRHLTPCNACLDAFQAVMLSRGGLLTGDTLITSVTSQEQDGQLQYLLEVRPLKALLPMVDNRQHSFPGSSIPSLPVTLSPSATALLQKRQACPMTDAHIRETMQRALAGFAESALNKRSARGEEYLGTGLMLYPDLPGSEPVLETGSSLHIKNSEPLYAELDALSNARNIKPGTLAHEHLQHTLQAPALVEELTRPHPDSHLKDKRKMPPLVEGLAMVGFVHRQNDQPRPKLLGLLKDAAGGRDFLVGLIEQGVIKVYAAQEFLPIQYKDHREPSQGMLLQNPPSAAASIGIFIRQAWAWLRGLLCNIFRLRSA